MSNNHLKSVINNFRELYESSILTDLILIINGEKIKCHQCILYSSSEYFKGYLNFHENSKELIISNDLLTLSGVKHCLRYIYSFGDNYFVEVDACQEAYIAADYLQLTNFKQQLSNLISGNINNENAISIWRFANSFNDKALRLRAQNFINNHFNEIDFNFDDNDAFLGLEFSHLKEILSDKNMNATDGSILKVLLRWAEQDYEGRHAVLLTEIEEIVRPNFISSTQWSQLIGSCRYSDFVRKVKEKLTNSSHLYVPLNHRQGTPTVVYKFGPKYNDQNAVYIDNNSVKPMENMHEERVNHQICCSSNFIFVIGGESIFNGYILRSCERYNLVEKKWEEMAELDNYRSNYTVVSLEGFVYLYGGFITDDQGYSVPTKDIMIYDSGRDQWSRSGFQLPHELIDGVGTAIDGSVFLVWVGVHGLQVMEWDPVTGEVSELSKAGLPTTLGQPSLTSGSSFQPSITPSIQDSQSVQDSSFLLLSIVPPNEPGALHVYNYHFSLNRWRPVLRTPLSHFTDISYQDESQFFATVLCHRDQISIVLELASPQHLADPQFQSVFESEYRIERKDETCMLLFFNYRIQDGWSGSLDIDCPDSKFACVSTTQCELTLSPLV